MRLEEPQPAEVDAVEEDHLEEHGDGEGHGQHAQLHQDERHQRQQRVDEQQEERAEHQEEQDPEDKTAQHTTGEYN